MRLFKYLFRFLKKMKTDAVIKFPSQFSCSKIKFVDNNSQDPKSALFSFTLPVAALFALHAFGVLLGKNSTPSENLFR